MNFAGLKFGGKTSHHVLMLLDAGQPLKGGAFNEDFVVILSAGKIIDLDGALRVILLKAFLQLFWCHRLQS